MERVRGENKKRKFYSRVVGIQRRGYFDHQTEKVRENPDDEYS